MEASDRAGVMQARVPLDASDEAVTRRVRALRHYLCGSGYGAQTQFATRMGIAINVWNNIEYGKPVSRFVARAIWENYPEWVSLDWIYFGDESGMLREFVGKLQQAMAAIDRIDDPEPPHSGSSGNRKRRSR